jgi:uncharacterized protein (DUF2461 family)
MTTETVPVFTGWPADATAFLAAIAVDNTAEFWDANRHRYAASVLPPLQAMAAALQPEFGAMRIFRPYRSRRFRPDADPYRSDAGGALTSEGGTEFSVLLSASALSVRIGHYLFDRLQLRRYREALSGEPGDRLVTLLAELDAAGLALGDVPALVGRPRGYAADHERLPLLRLRALHVGRSWPTGEWLGTPEPLARVAGAWRAARTLADWLDEHVGPSAPRW